MFKKKKKIDRDKVLSMLLNDQMRLMKNVNYITRVVGLLVAYSKLNNEGEFLEKLGAEKDFIESADKTIH